MFYYAVEVTGCLYYVQDDEFAVYNVSQQRIRYLVEFTASGDEPLIEHVISDLPTSDVESRSVESQQKGIFL